MQLSSLDWSIIIAIFALSLFIGIWVSKRAGKNATEFFLSGRNMPWWLLGVSMVATTFSADTPNLVTSIVRSNGVAGNWEWWAFLLTGMLTVFVYAKLWRRSGVLTDLEFYELRYSGKPAAFLRGFRAIYLGVFFNVMIMATVMLAAIKIGSVLLDLSPTETILISAIITVLYTALGGLRGVIFTDFFQFLIAMIGTIGAAIVIVNIPEVGGVESLLKHGNVIDKINLLPDFSDPATLIPLLIIPLAVQWWSVWYPGAEPGGGGYIAQRMLSAKNEQNAIGATFLFNIAHYALRPWPWILIALASLILFPMQIAPDPSRTVQIAADTPAFLAEQVSDDDLALLQTALQNRVIENQSTPKLAEYERLQEVFSTHTEAPEIQSLAYIFSELNAGKGVEELSDPLDAEALVYLQLAYPDVSIDKLGNDLGYSAMLPFLPSGLLGLVIASLIAAFMSTISTHLNWGSSYVVHDFYRRFLKPEVSDREQVMIGRISTVVLMILSALIALALSDALQAFKILLQIGAGTGLIFILRWFWWRINAYSELTAMIVSFIIAVYFEMGYSGELPSHYKLVLGVAITTVAWIVVTLLTPPDDHSTLLSFFKKIRPHKGGWKPVLQRAKEEGELETEIQPTGRLPLEILCMVAGCFAVYAVLFATGFIIYGETASAIISLVVAGISIAILWRSWRQVSQ